MPIEIREMLIRTIWGSESLYNNSPESNADNSKKKAAESAGEGIQDMSASIKKMIEQSQER